MISKVLILKQGEAPPPPSGGSSSGMGDLLSSLAGQYFGGRRVADIRERIKDRATPEEIERFERRQKQAEKFARGVGVLAGIDSFGRNLAEGKFRPLSAINTGMGAGITTGSIAAPFLAEREGKKIGRRIQSEPVRVTRPVTQAETKRYNLPRGQQTFDMSTTGGLPDLTPELKEPTRTMPEEQVKVLAPTAPPSPTQNNLKQFTEKDMVKIINRDDAEDAREEKRLNAKNLDGSNQMQGNV